MFSSAAGLSPVVWTFWVTDADTSASLDNCIYAPKW